MHFARAVAADIFVARMERQKRVYALMARNPGFLPYCKSVVTAPHSITAKRSGCRPIAGMHRII